MGAPITIASETRYEFPDVPDILGELRAWEASIPEAERGVVRVGVEPHLRLVYVNHSLVPVRVPTDPLARAATRAMFRQPGDMHDAWGAFPVAGTDAWTTVGAGDTTERLVPLSRWFPDCVGGCPAGTYRLRFTPIEAAPPDDISVIPALDAVIEFRVAWPTAAAPSAALSVDAVPRGGRLALRVTNTTPQAVWIPASGLDQCDTSLPDGTGGGSRSATGGQSPYYDEKQAIRVRPGRSVVVRTTCAIPRDAWSVTATRANSASFWPARPHAEASLWVYDRPLSAEYLVENKRVTFIDE